MSFLSVSYHEQHDRRYDEDEGEGGVRWSSFARARSQEKKKRRKPVCCKPVNLDHSDDGDETSPEGDRAQVVPYHLTEGRTGESDYYLFIYFNKRNCSA